MTTATVCIATYRRPELLRRCLVALAAGTLAPDETIVVVRSSDPASAEVACDAAPGLDVRVLEVDCAGHLPPLRRAVAAAAGDVVAFVDDDAEPWRQWLASLVRHYARASVGGVGGLVDQPATDTRRVARSVGRVGPSGRFDRMGFAQVPAEWGPRRVDALIGTNMSYRRSLLARYAWDARLNGGAATDYEIDLGAWIRRAGYELVYDPDAIVTHHLGVRPDLGRAASSAAIRAYSHNLVYVSGKALPARRRAAALAHTFLVGTRASYGLATALADVARGRASVRDTVVPAFAGKLAGLRSLVAYARRGPAPLDSADAP